MRKKGIRVLVNSRNGFWSLWFAALAGFPLPDAAYSIARRLNLSGSFAGARGVLISEAELSQFAEDAGARCAARAVPGVDDVHAYADAIQRFCESAVWVCVVC